MWEIGHLIGGLAGAVVIVLLLLAAAVAMYLRSRRAPIDHTNVNDEWPDAPTTERVPAGVVL
jgi:inorganic phosphate transporter, PiT family